MGPRADFMCPTKACQQDGAASVYELPVGATRCPMCGSKRLRRLFNAVNVGSADARAHGKLIDQSSLGAQHDAARAQAAAPKETPVLKIAARGALGAVQAYPGSAVGSRGGTDPTTGQPVIGSVNIIRALGKPRPHYG